MTKDKKTKLKLCEECHSAPAKPGFDWCNHCLEEEAIRWEEEEEDYSDFDCTCGAWQWNKKEGRPIHVADCICGSSEPW